MHAARVSLPARWVTCSAWYVNAAFNALTKRVPDRAEGVCGNTRRGQVRRHGGEVGGVPVLGGAEGMDVRGIDEHAVMTPVRAPRFH